MDYDLNLPGDLRPDAAGSNRGNDEMKDGVMQQNNDGSWSPARPIGYFWDSRPLWLKIIEFPWRLIGVVRYDPLIEVPVDEMDWNWTKKNHL